MNRFITVFTPTYNRAHTLPKLYESLCKQKRDLFSWIIVDDGSTDKTEELIESYIQDKMIDIQYIKQKNAGKMVAHNTALAYASTELFFCVDSDDWVSDNSIEDIVRKWDEIRDLGYAGIIGYRAFPDGRINGDRFSNANKSGTVYDMNHVYRKKGDTSIVYRTDILRNFLYPQFEGEKFVPDASIYYQIDDLYEVYFWDKVLSIGMYLEGGYTSIGTVIAIKNPNGYAFYKKIIMERAKDRKEKFKARIGYLGYSILAKNFVKVCKDIGIVQCIICIPISIIFILRLRIVAKKQRNKLS